MPGAVDVHANVTRSGLVTVELDGGLWRRMDTGVLDKAGSLERMRTGECAAASSGFRSTTRPKPVAQPLLGHANRSLYPANTASEHFEGEFELVATAAHRR
jgi:hypothetical protein